MVMPQPQPPEDIRASRPYLLTRSPLKTFVRRAFSIAVLVAIDLSGLVIGLYLAFLIPIWLRLRAGDAFTPGEWTLGPRYRWMCRVAVVEIVVISVYFVLPFSPSGVPFADGFTWTAVNYAPILTGGALLVLWAAWHLSAKKWYTGPITTAAVVAHPPAG